MTDATLTSYEQIPYESAPIHGVHPDNLAALATLFGLNPPSLENCRVLELGCSTGGNLISIADSLPGARCVGLDLSPGQIATGRELVQAIGLKNIDLRAGSILDVGADWGTFDYILCHGVYSWVPPEVQDHILTVCSRNLAPGGVAYVSYNVYPGWHISGMMRDMINFHGRRFADPHERMTQVRGLIDFLIDLAERDPESSLFNKILMHELPKLREHRDAYLFHEYLEDFNQPLYFHQFVERAAAKGLQYLSETHLVAMVSQLPAALQETLEGWSEDVVQYEQYLDFVRNRRFRKTLLCHASEKLSRSPSPDAMRRIRLTANARPVAVKPDPSPTAVEQFSTPSKMTMSTNDPWMRTALRVLDSVSPRGLSFAELMERIPPALPDGIEVDEERLKPILLRCVLSSLAEPHLVEPACVTEISKKPVASALARIQAPQSSWVTNRRHRNIRLEGIYRALVPALDGSRDQAALVEMLAVQVLRDGVELRGDDGQPVSEPGRVHELLAGGVVAALELLAKSAVLVG